MGDITIQTGDTRIRYAIQIKGQLGATLRDAFPELQPEYRNGYTVLVGALADQAELYGILGQVEALGLELVEVRRLRQATSADPQ